MHSQNIDRIVQPHRQQCLHEAEQDRPAQQIDSHRRARIFEFAAALGNWLIALSRRLNGPSPYPRQNGRTGTPMPTRIIKV